MNRRNFLKLATGTAGLAIVGYVFHKTSSVAEMNKKREIHSLSLPEIKARAQKSRAVYATVSGPTEDLMIFQRDDGKVIFYQRVDPESIDDGSIVFEETDLGLTARLYKPGPRTDLVYPDLAILENPRQQDDNWRQVTVTEELNNGRLAQRRFKFGAKLFDGLERIETFDNSGTLTDARIIDKSKVIYQVSLGTNREYTPVIQEFHESLKRK